MRGLQVILRLPKRADFEQILEDVIGKNNFLVDGIQGLDTKENARVHYVFRENVDLINRGVIRNVSRNLVPDMDFYNVSPEYEKHLDEEKGRFKQLTGI